MARTLIASLCAALVVVVALLFVPWPSAKRGNPANSSSGGTGSSGSASGPDSGGSPASKLPREKRTHEPEEDPIAPIAGTHTPEQLKDFIIPELALEDASLEEALAELLKVYGEICRETDQTPLPFSTSIAQRLNFKISADLSGQSFLSALRQISAQAGATISQTGTELNFAPLAGGPFEPPGLANPTRQIKYTTKVLASSQELDSIASRVFSPEQLAEVLHLASKQQLAVQSLPSLILRREQDAKIRLPGESEPIMSTSASPYGFGVSATITAERPADQGTGEETASISKTDIVPAGHWIVRSEETPDGIYRYYFLRPNVVDSTGRVLYDQSR